MQLISFSKVIPYFNEDLTLKSSEKAREILGLTFEETMKIFTFTMVCRIEEYLLQFTTNPQGFDEYARKALSSVKLKKLTGNYY